MPNGYQDITHPSDRVCAISHDGLVYRPRESALSDRRLCTETRRMLQALPVFRPQLEGRWESSGTG